MLKTVIDQGRTKMVDQHSSCIGSTFFFTLELLCLSETVKMVNDLHYNIKVNTTIFNVLGFAHQCELYVTMRLLLHRSDQ